MKGVVTRKSYFRPTLVVVLTHASNRIAVPTLWAGLPVNRVPVTGAEPVILSIYDRKWHAVESSQPGGVCCG
jgi:hypothetical protein